MKQPRHNNTARSGLSAVSIAFAVMSITAKAQPADSTHVIDRMTYHSDAIHTTGLNAYRNPATRLFLQGPDITSVGMGYGRSEQSKAVTTQLGSGSDDWVVGASTHIYNDNSALWGHAEYTKGHIRAVLWNETADYALVYPYVTADEQGGDLNRETYCFSGAYAARKGRWTWGTELSYKAGQYYRDTDPRPKNITGQLDITAGGGNTIGNYVIAASISFMSYKQNSDIDFKSELGQTTICHLTGLGTDYARFRGNGFDTGYGGSQWTASIDLVPQNGNGWFATTRLSRLTMETLLNDMNKLPMAEIWNNSIEAQAGYRHWDQTTAWIVYGQFNAYRRHGKENVFGDAASSTYPQIGTVEMYADNGLNATVAAVYETHIPAVTLSYSPSLSCSHRCQIYADPAREWLIDNISTGHTATAMVRPGRRWTAEMQLSWSLTAPTSSRLRIDEDGTSIGGLMKTVASDFSLQSATMRSYMVRVGAGYAMDRRHALSVTATYRRDSYASGVFANTLNVGAALTL